MTRKVAGRRRARHACLKLLFQREFRGIDAETLLAEFDTEDPFVARIVRGVEAHGDELDAVIREKARGWELDRLVSVDRNVLRLALYELRHTDTPPEVVINEAVELAKRYGTEASASFINGVLDRVWKELAGAVR